MKIVQALWFNKNTKSVDYTAGWLDMRYHLMSWTLSSLLLSRYNKSIELITDSIGHDLLIERLKLPYNIVSTEFDQFAVSIADQFWALKKIYAYSIHEEPFVFIDGDVFSFNPILFNNQELLAQNFETNFSFYRPVQTAIEQTCAINGSYLDNDLLNAVNTGIVGGNDYKFFKKFSNKVFDFVTTNERALRKIVSDFHIETKYVNVWLEQYCLYNYAKHHNKQFSFYLNNIVVEDDYRYLADFTKLPSRQAFLHIMHLAKANPTVCEQLSQRLYIESPEMYERVEDVCRQLRSTHHLINIPSPSFRLPFERTVSLIKKVINRNDLPNGLGIEYDNIRSIIGSMLDVGQKAVLDDVLNYEITIQNFKHILPNALLLKESWKSYSLAADQLLQGAEVDFLGKLLKRSKYYLLLESEWNWSEQNEYTGQLDNRDLSINLETQSSYYAVVLYLYIHQNSIREHLLDAINILILDALEVPTSVVSVIGIVNDQVLCHQPQTDQKQLSDTILSRIRHFLYHGVLEVAP